MGSDSEDEIPLSRFAERILRGESSRPRSRSAGGRGRSKSRPRSRSRGGATARRGSAAGGRRLSPSRASSPTGPALGRGSGAAASSADPPQARGSGASASAGPLRDDVSERENDVRGAALAGTYSMSHQELLDAIANGKLEAGRSVIWADRGGRGRHTDQDYQPRLFVGTRTKDFRGRPRTQVIVKGLPSVVLGANRDHLDQQAWTEVELRAPQMRPGGVDSVLPSSASFTVFPNPLAPKQNRVRRGDWS